MPYWIEPRHPWCSSPIHPLSYERDEGARLYIDKDKVERVQREMKVGDKVFFYETMGHPTKDYQGAGAIGALVTVASDPYQQSDSHTNALTGKPEDWKVDCQWDICLHDWSNGVPLKVIREVLGNKSPWAPRSLLRITEEKFHQLLEELKKPAATSSTYKPPRNSARR
jgi:hypothetical protein